MNSTQVSRILDEEHRSNLDLLGKIEQAMARTPRFDPALGGLLGQLAHGMEHEVDRHFRFEEEQLFPRMTEAGDGGMAGLLTEEHEAIREVTGELLPLTRLAVQGTIDEAGWSTLRRTALELVERLVSHIQKETMALLPLLDDMLDAETDRELAFAYSAED